jgi:hypothetical protein
LYFFLSSICLLSSLLSGFGSSSAPVKQVSTCLLCSLFSQQLIITDIIKGCWRILQD